MYACLWNMKLDTVNVCMYVNRKLGTVDVYTYVLKGYS